MISRAVLAPACVAFVTACWGTNVDLGGTSSSAGETDAEADGSGSLVCRYYAPPSVRAPCDSCVKGDEGCQPNGCYLGWYCDVGYHYCHPPVKCDGGSRGGFR